MLSLNMPSWKPFRWFRSHSYEQLVIGSFIKTTRLLRHHVSCRVFLVKHQITQVIQPPYSPDLVPCVFWLFLKLKPPLKGKRFQTINEIQENTTGQLMKIGRGIWGPKLATLKETEASLSYVQCSCILHFFNYCLFFSHYMAGFILVHQLYAEIDIKKTKLRK